MVRTRDLWTALGFAVLIPDAVDGDNLRGRRSSESYADLVAKLVAFAHRQVDGPVFLLGTSQGSIAAMNGAAHLRDGQIAGLVLTESVSRLGGSHETVFSAHPDRISWLRTATIGAGSHRRSMRRRSQPRSFTRRW